MRYAVIYQSKSGNTQQIAEEIYESLAAYDKEIFNLDEISTLPEADVYLIGFGIRNGSCSLDVLECLEQITDGYYALFATCGFLATEQYQDMLENKLEVWLPEDAEYLGMFLCQGRTDPAQQTVMENQSPNNAQTLHKMFEMGNTHPDDSDLQKASRFARMIQSQLD